MEFRLKLMKVMEKSWNFEIMAKSHGKVMEFCRDNFVATLCEELQAGLFSQ